MMHHSIRPSPLKERALQALCIIPLSLMVAFFAWQWKFLLQLLAILVGVGVAGGIGCIALNYLVYKPLVWIHNRKTAEERAAWRAGIAGFLLALALVFFVWLLFFSDFDFSTSSTF